MLDRPIVAFDIETIPDPDIGPRVLGLAGDDHAVETLPGTAAAPPIKTTCLVAPLSDPREAGYILRVVFNILAIGAT